MKVKVTATITLETEIFPEDYVDAGISGEEAVIAYVTQQMYDVPYEGFGAQLCAEGEVSNIKIEKIADDATAQEQAA